eukprot:4706108-Alexandrium_andersonii.AAC.1
MPDRHALLRGWLERLAPALHQTCLKGVKDGSGGGRSARSCVHIVDVGGDGQGVASGGLRIHSVAEGLPFAVALLDHVAYRNPAQSTSSARASEAPTRPALDLHPQRTTAEHDAREQVHAHQSSSECRAEALVLQVSGDPYHTDGVVKGVYVGLRNAPC